jgi:hypothetical protein
VWALSDRAAIGAVRYRLCELIKGMPDELAQFDEDLCHARVSRGKVEHEDRSHCKTCNNCKHWGGAKGGSHGLCESDDVHEKCNGENVQSMGTGIPQREVWTGPMFGCIYWEHV